MIISYCVCSYMHIPCISTPSQFICVTQLSEVTMYLRIFVPLCWRRNTTVFARNALLAWSITVAVLKVRLQLAMYIRYSSKVTWYPHACCRLNIVEWRLHHAFNIWTGTHYVHARNRQIVWHVHPRMLHLFWMNF